MFGYADVWITVRVGLEFHNVKLCVASGYVCEYLIVQIGVFNNCFIQLTQGIVVT